MKIKYIEDIDILSIELQKGDFEYSEEIGEGIILDIGADGDILSVEILDAGRRLGRELLEKVARKYLAEV